MVIRRLPATLVLLAAFASPSQRQMTAQSTVITVPLTYQAPGSGPKPNFSPKGTQVALTAVPAEQILPAGAVPPAKRGTLQVGPGRDSWIPVLVAASTAHPQDLNQLFIDRNRNGNFADDGPASVATPTQNAKTKAWWSSFNALELRVRFPEPERTEPYFVNFWIVREDAAPPPDVIRYSRGSWRSGTVTVNGTAALVAAMDGNNDALRTRRPYGTRPHHARGVPDERQECRPWPHPTVTSGAVKRYRPSLPGVAGGAKLQGVAGEGSLRPGLSATGTPGRR